MKKLMIASLLTCFAGAAHAIEISHNNNACMSTATRGLSHPDLLGHINVADPSTPTHVCVRHEILERDVLNAISIMNENRHVNDSDYDRHTTKFYVFHTKYDTSSYISFSRLKTWMDALEIPQEQRGELQFTALHDFNGQYIDSYDISTDENLARPVLRNLRQQLEGKDFVRVNMRQTIDMGCPGCELYKEHILYFLDYKVVYIKAYQHSS